VGGVDRGVAVARGDPRRWLRGRRGPWRQAGGRFVRRPVGVVALLVVVALAVAAFLAGKLAPYAPGQIFIEYLNSPQPPSLHHGHLLGTDGLGHDELSQLLYALRSSMTSALISAAGAAVIGMFVGAVAGYAGGLFDAVVSWLVGVVVTMPALAVVVLVVIYNLPLATVWYGVTLMLVLWTTVARVVRAEVVALLARPFVEAARAAGASPLRVIVRHLLPNAAGSILVAATSTFGQSILIVATVDFFSYGIGGIDNPTLGGLVAQAIYGLGLLERSGPWWLYAAPSVVLGLLLICVNFAADSLDEALDPSGA
jgi:ABC-type dipeptide/oligopeptide/nickel transport system permease subunit